MTDQMTIQEYAAQNGISVRHAQRLAEKGSIPGAVKRAGRWTVRLTARPDINLDGIARPKIDQAAARLKLIEGCRAFCADAVTRGFQHSQAMTDFAALHGIPLRTLQRWIAEHRRGGLSALVDGRGGGGQVQISPDAWDRFLLMYLTPQQLSVAICWRNLCYINQSEERGWQIPSLRAMQIYANSRIPKGAAVLHRLGRGAYDAQFAPYIKTDPDSIPPGAVWIGDHHQADCWVRSRGRWVRPWLTAWEDMRSRGILGWTITEQPNSSTILQAFRSGCRSYGPPDSVKIDNGKDYDSEMFTGTTKQRRRITSKLHLDEEVVAGLYSLMDISVSFAIPYHPQSKAIERFFDTFEQQFIRTFDTWCGRTTATRPEDLFDRMKRPEFIASAPTIEEFIEQAGQYIEVYNHSVHGGRGMEGQSPAQVIAARPSRRMLAEGVLDLLCRCWSGLLTVGKNGVSVRGLDYGAADPSLLAWQGRKVRVAWDPEDITQVWVYEPATYKLITIASQWKMVAYGASADDAALRQARTEQSRARKLVRAARPAARVAATDLTSLTLAAMASRTSQNSEVRGQESENSKLRIQNSKLVPTVMDSQVAAHRRLANIKKVRRAAGAEGTGFVPQIDLDYATMNADSLNPPGPVIELDFETEPEKPNLKLSWD